MQTKDRQVHVIAGFGKNGKVLFARSYKHMNSTAAISIFRRSVLPSLKRNFPGRRRSTLS